MADLPNLANIAAAPGTDYVERINRAIDHVLRHLAELLPLDEVARAAHFSPYHFHRIFKALVGGTVHDFVKRVRLEHALNLLSHRQGVSLTEVALACGFSSSSDFSRSFRGRFGVPPRAASGWATSGTTRRSCRWTSAATTSGSRFPMARPWTAR